MNVHLLALPVLLLSLAYGSDMPAKERFPYVTASNLAGQKFSLPNDFEGDRNLLLVAFQREQQKNVDTWLHEMKRFEEIDHGLRYYELPTIARLNAFSRWFIDSGMRRGIPDQSARERTITLYVEKAPFEKALNIATEQTIYVFLVDKAGNVLWRTDGDFDEKKAESLRQALEQQEGRK